MVLPLLVNAVHFTILPDKGLCDFVVKTRRHLRLLLKVPPFPEVTATDERL